MTMNADQAALRDLDHHWGEAYDIALTPADWVAKRLDKDAPQWPAARTGCVICSRPTTAPGAVARDLPHCPARQP